MSDITCLDSDQEMDENQDMDIETSNDTSNDTIEDHFQHLLDKAIEYGDCCYITTAINLYGKIIDKRYVELANKIYFQLVEEKIEDMSI